MIQSIILRELKYVFNETDEFIAVNFNLLNRILFWFFAISSCSDLMSVCVFPTDVIKNINLGSSMINNVDFHPDKNLFCATYTHNNQVVIYQLNEFGKSSVFQVLDDSLLELDLPQHALFSNDGNNLIISNWGSQTFNIFQVNKEGLFEPKPIGIIYYSSDLGCADYRPHGMAFSPNGKYLVVAYGASMLEPRAVALYDICDLNTKNANFRLISLLKGEEIDAGIPKGVVFSPDGSCVVVTFSMTNSLAVYPIDWGNGHIISTPRQIIAGISTDLLRPEDIKFRSDGDYCAVSNSTGDTVTFYNFDKINNCFVQDAPVYIIKSPQAQLKFPHGLAFSPDGKYLVVSQFGDVKFRSDGRLSSWASKNREKITIYNLEDF